MNGLPRSLSGNIARERRHDLDARGELGGPLIEQGAHAALDPLDQVHLRRAPAVADRVLGDDGLDVIEVGVAVADRAFLSFPALDRNFDLLRSRR